jgi:uncharacterized protein
MQVTLEGNYANYRIHAYEPGHVAIAIPNSLEQPPEGHRDNGASPHLWRDRLEHSFVITPERLIRNWGSDDFSELRARHFSELLALDPEIVLFGSGKRLRRPSAETLAVLTNAGVGVEIMDTGAACRTFNILMNDERRVAAALMIIEDD